MKQLLLNGGNPHAKTRKGETPLHFAASKGDHIMVKILSALGVDLQVRYFETLPRKVDIRLPGKGDSNSHGARPVHQKHRWIRTSRLSIKNSLSLETLLSSVNTQPEPISPEP